MAAKVKVCSIFWPSSSRERKKSSASFSFVPAWSPTKGTFFHFQFANELPKKIPKKIDFEKHLDYPSILNRIRSCQSKESMIFGPPKRGKKTKLVESLFHFRRRFESRNAINFYSHTLDSTQLTHVHQCLEFVSVWAKQLWQDVPFLWIFVKDFRHNTKGCTKTGSPFQCQA